MEDALEPSLPRGLFIATSERAGEFDPPEVGKLVKQRSTLYQGATRPSDGAESTASTAPGGYQADGPTPLQLQALQRPADGRFDAVIEAMQELVNTRDLIGFDVVAPPHPSMPSQRGGLACWNFLDAAARMTQHWPKSGWRVLRNAKASGAPVRRCALVLGVQSIAWHGYWIEIEGHGSNGTYTSPVLVDLSACSHDALLKAVIETIAFRKGRKLASTRARGRPCARRRKGGVLSAWVCIRRPMRGRSSLDSLRPFIGALR